MFEKGQIPILGIMRGIKTEDVEPLAELCIKNGIKYIEITMNTENALQLISNMKSTSKGRLVVGAGTVLNVVDMDQALTAGAEFIVSPSVVDNVIMNCVKNNIPVFPGALTPTEIQKAWDLGATMVKLFPASLFGPAYIKELKGPFNKIRIMAVGGVSEANIHMFFKNGAEAVAFGSSIFNLKWLREKQYGLIEEKLKALINGYKIVNLKMC